MIADISRLRTMTSSPSLILNQSSEITADVSACIRYVSSLESVWQGSQRSRMILEEVWEYTRSKSRAGISDSMMADLLSS